MKSKIRTYSYKVNTNFRGLNVPKDDKECNSFTVISIDSLLVYNKKYYLQVHLHNCACKTIKNKRQIILMKIFLKIRYYKCCFTKSLIEPREMILLKVATAKNVWFATISFLIMDWNFKIAYAMVFMIWQRKVLIEAILLFTIKNVDYCCIIHNISKSEAISLLENFSLEYRGYI